MTVSRRKRGGDMNAIPAIGFLIETVP